MRTSHKKIQKLINEEKATITDEELFSSDAFRGYLTDIAEVVSKRYKRPLKITTFYNDDKKAGIACTDNAVININVANSIIKSLPGRVLKTESLIGILGHELGHVNFTNFTLSNLFFMKLSSGQIYPEEPKTESMSEEMALKEFHSYFASNDETAIEVIVYVVKNIMNITEDAYIEAKMCNEFPGKIKRAIYLSRLRMNESTLSIKKQIENGFEPLSIMQNLILSYATSGEINNLGNYNGEYLDKFKECISAIDDCIFDDNIKCRMRSSISIMLKLWKYIKQAIDKQKSEPKEGTVKSKMESEGIPSSAMPTGDSTPVSGSLPSKPSGGTKLSPSLDKPMIEKIKKVVEEEGNRIKLKKTDEITTNGNGSIKKNSLYSGAGYEQCGKDIERIMNKIATNKVNIAEERNLAAELQNEANGIRYGSIHRNVNITVSRMSCVNQYLIDAYNSVAPSLLALSKRLQEGILKVVKEKKNGAKYTGLFMGRKMEARSFVHDDGRYFYRNTLPSDTLDLAVALLVDESGSMSCCDRITSARAASIVIYDFCNKLGIPINVTGHSTNEDGVELFSYADFNSIDGCDKYRIMDMSARNGNRDGAALRYVAEQLNKRSEKIKLLILISDGQPADSGYIGTAAEADLRSIKQEYTKKGIIMFAAAIGEDKENIRRIYKDGFLDITDINKLPLNLVTIVARYLK